MPLPTPNMGHALVKPKQVGEDPAIEEFDPTDPYRKPTGHKVLRRNRNGDAIIINKVGKPKLVTEDRLLEEPNGKERVIKPAPIGYGSVFTAPTYQTHSANEVRNMKQQADKRNKDGILTKKPDFDGTLIEKKHEPVCPANESVCPCTEERDSRPVKPFVGTASDMPKFVKVASKDDEAIIKKPFDQTLTASAKKELMEKTAMYDAVYMMPGKCQWCPKLRNAVSMHTCATVCPEGRRIPQKKSNETYTDYLMKGGSDEGEVKCGLKQWMEVEMDKYYPGWVEDHIKKAGGSVVGSETNFGNRHMNLSDDERRHLPRYPEEKLIEKVMERERHVYENNDTKLASNSAKRIMSAGASQKKNGVGYNGLDKEALRNPFPQVTKKVRDFFSSTEETDIESIYNQLQSIDINKGGNAISRTLPLFSRQLKSLLTKLIPQAKKIGIEPIPTGIADLKQMHQLLQTLTSMIYSRGGQGGVDTTKIDIIKKTLSQALGIANAIANKPPATGQQPNPAPATSPAPAMMGQQASSKKKSSDGK